MKTYKEINQHNKKLNNKKNIFKKKILTLNQELERLKKQEINTDVFDNFLKNIFYIGIGKKNSVLTIQAKLNFGSYPPWQVIEYDNIEEAHIVNCPFNWNQIFSINTNNINNVVKNNIAFITKNDQDKDFSDKFEDVDKDTLYGIWSEKRLFYLNMKTNWTVTKDINDDIDFLKKNGPKFLCLASKNRNPSDKDFQNGICIPNPKVYKKIDSINIKEKTIKAIFKKYQTCSCNEFILKDKSKYCSTKNNNPYDELNYDKHNLSSPSEDVVSDEDYPDNYKFYAAYKHLISNNIVELCALFDFAIVNKKINKKYLKNFNLHYFKKIN